MPTIGVSVLVPEPWGSQLQQYRIGLGDESARTIPTHITLLPPYSVPQDAMGEVLDHLEEAAALTRPFQVHLRGTGTFQPVSPVVFVGVVAGISSCEQLAARVRRGPLASEKTFPYHPHVTLAHDLPPRELDQAFTEMKDFDATFDVGQMWMYLHEDVSGWHPDRAFALGS